MSAESRPCHAPEPRPEYVELHARSAFSMLDGASSPETLVRRAAELGLSALALTDLNDLGGAVRFAQAAEVEGLEPLFGAELSLRFEGEAERGDPIVLLCESARGWANLAELITTARMRSERGFPAVDLDTLGSHAEGLVCLSGGRDSPLERARLLHGEAEMRRRAGALAELFRGRLYVEVQDHRLAEDVPRVRALLALARRLDLPWLVTGDVRHASSADKLVHDALRCIALGIPLDQAGDRLFPNDTRRLASAAEQARAFREAPAGLLCTLEVRERCAFHLLRDLRPKLPRFALPEGVDDADAWLEARTLEGMRRRYERPRDRHLAQIRHELAIIRRLGLAGYFLIVHEIVRFAASRDILVQGRGSAANSVVCYCLGITSVDPIGLELLFERFLSEERGEAPDIDIDIEHQRREEVLQHVYDRYGREHAAMVCETITFRAKSAVRDAARLLGLPIETADRLSREVGSAVPTDARPEGSADAAESLERGGLERAGLDPRASRSRALLRILRGLEGLPRHRSIHVGGFVLTGERLSGVVPIEPASMAGRTVIQWDKDDLDPIGLVKIDLLGLGMLTALSDALRRVRRDRGRPLALHTIPADDGPTYEMIRRADTVGVFQIESRAQMSSLPRNAPDRFYDLVVQVALIRPGPIQGEMVHPYLRRRRGLEPIRTLHPLLEPVLRRTLGVPLFQEQGMRVAVVAAGFSPGQADALRRAMGSKRSRSQMSRLSLQLLAGMQERGIDRAIAERIIKQLGAFASYGFPESHAASFALLVYASAYLKRHYAPEFYAALLDAQPMGFYPVGSLLTDARRHGVEVRPLDVRRSGWGARLEGTRGGAHPFALRLGLGMIRGLGPGAKRGVMRALERGGPRSIEDFARSSGLGQPSLRKLAKAGAFDALAGDRRRALWEVLRLGRVPAGPFDLRAEDPQPPPLCAPSLRDRVAADYESLGGSAERHPIELLRPSLELAGIGTLRALRRREEGPVRVAGLVCSRQRPATAKGFVFLALEDETEMLNVIVHPDLFARRRERIVSSPVLVIDGRLQRSSGTLDLVAEEIEGLDAVPGADAAGSHDFH